MKSLTLTALIALPITLLAANALLALFGISSYEAMLFRSFHQTVAVGFLAYVLIRRLPKDDAAVTPAMLVSTAGWVFATLAGFTVLSVILAGVRFIKAAELIYFQAIAIGIMTYVPRRALGRLHAARPTPSV